MILNYGHAFAILTAQVLFLFWFAACDGDYSGQCFSGGCVLKIGGQEFPCHMERNSSLCYEYDAKNENDRSVYNLQVNKVINRLENACFNNVSWNYSRSNDKNLDGFLIIFSIPGWPQNISCYLISLDSLDTSIMPKLLRNDNDFSVNCLPVQECRMCTTILPFRKKITWRNTRETRMSCDEDWNFSLEASYNKMANVLHIKYIPMPGDEELPEKYDLTLIKCAMKNEMLSCLNEPKVWTISTFNKSEILVKQVYSPGQFQVWIKRNDCQDWNIGNTFNLSGNNTFEINDCITETDWNNWNTSITLEPDSTKRSMVVSLQPLGYCLPERIGLHVKLFVRRNDSVVKYCDNTLYWTNIEVIMDPSSATVTFYDLQPGNYCVRVSPVDPKRCPGNCLILYSEVRTLEEKKTVLPTVMEISSSPNNPFDPTWLIVLGVALAVGAFLVIFFVARFLKERKRRRGGTTEPPNDIPEILPPPNKDNEIQVLLEKSKRILVIHAPPENKAEGDINRKFQTFLSECHFGEVICMQCNDNIFNDALNLNSMECWWMAEFQKADRILIITSLTAQNITRDYLHQIEPAVCSTNQIRAFQSGLLSIMRDPDMQMDYSKVFVVRFQFTLLEESRLPITPGRTYEVPQDLPALFRNFHAINNGTTVDVLKMWDSTTPYTDLLASLQKYEMIRVSETSAL